MALELRVFLYKILCPQLLLNSLGDFFETWYKERSQCVDVHITREMLFSSPIYEGGVMAL
jgi:hypothetical protein